MSLDYIFGRTDNTQGIVEKQETIALKEQFANEEKMKSFVEFCFQPGTAGNEKLKAVLVEMLGGNPPKK